MEFCVPETTYKVQETSASNQCLDDTHSTPGYSTMTLETNESLTSDHKLTNESDNTAKIDRSLVSTDYRHNDTPASSATYSWDEAKWENPIQSPSASPLFTLPASKGDTMPQSGVKHKQSESWALWNTLQVHQDSKGVLFFI